MLFRSRGAKRLQNKLHTEISVYVVHIELQSIRKRLANIKPERRQYIIEEISEGCVSDKQKSHSARKKNREIF